MARSMREKVHDSQMAMAVMITVENVRILEGVWVVVGLKGAEE